MAWDASLEQSRGGGGVTLYKGSTLKVKLFQALYEKVGISLVEVYD